MTIIQSIISGILQGITEFLPISSSGHLVILHTLFGYTEPKVLEDVLLHAGTLVAIIIFFRKDIIGLVKDRKSVFLIVIGSIPIIIAVLIFGDFVEKCFSSIRTVGIALLITGTWLLLASLVSKSAEDNTEGLKISPLHALLIGISQAIALFPGISRSGATISTALMLKRSRDTAFRFSFLLSIPALFGAVLYKAGDITEISSNELTIMALGSIIACFTGLAALWCLRKVLIKGKLYYFSLYCFAAGLAVIFFM